MTPMQLTDAATDVTLDGRRAEVLAQLRSADRPLSVSDVAKLTGLHVNTARFHLDGLVDDELAARSTEPRQRPGRPRILYAAQARVPGPRSYGLLAEMLTGLVASRKDAGPAAIDEGRAWGRHLVERAAPSQRVDSAEAVARLTAMLEAVGFQPEAHHNTADPGKKGTEAELRLRHCPFREIAERHTDVICALHLGLMRGALEELNAPIDATSLEPFVTPNLCVALLHPTEAAG